MCDRLLRRREVEDMTGLSRSSIYRLMKLGLFPRPVKVRPFRCQVEQERGRRLDRVPAGSDERTRLERRLKIGKSTRCG